VAQRAQQVHEPSGSAPLIALLVVMQCVMLLLLLLLLLV